MTLSSQMIELKYILPYIASFFGLAISFCALLINRSLFVHRIFVGGMLILAAESLLTGLAVRAVVSEDALYWLSLRNLATAMIPGIWFVFCLCFTSVNYQEQLSKWKWVIAAIFVLPLSFALFFWENIYAGLQSLIPLNIWTIELEWPGYLFQLFVLLGIIMILLHIERILRHSVGHFRWKLKFMVLGIGVIFAARIYTISQALIFNSIKMELELINDAALILGGLMMIVSLSRMRSMDIKFYMSDTLIYNSLSILFIGAYFIAVGILAKFSYWIGDGHDLAFRAFFILLAFAGLISLFLSDRLKKWLKQFVSRHLKRPLYDYRQEWAKFTHNTTLVMDIEKLGDIVVRMVAKTFNVLSVTIWTLDESDKNVKMIASTVFSPSEKNNLESQKRLLEFILEIKNKNITHDIDLLEDELSSGLRDFDHKFFEELRIRYCIPLKARGNFIGIMALHNRIGGYRFTLEDFDLLKNMADQLASGMLNIMLAQDLRKAKQMEAFQRLSAFFVHDLKNLASNLSITIRNLPKHFDNPEFRKDTLKSLSQGVDKIGSMCSKLTSLSQKTDLDLQSTDLNVIVSNVISNVNGSFGQKITKKLESLPKINLDPEQFQKVITNLILNAHEATNKEGNVYITTKHEGGWVILTVQDNGKGMDKDFMESSLFQPFKTTKEKGMGIGLYHSRDIVEAHHGKIEVESRLGKGCTFKVLLPVKSE